MVNDGISSYVSREVDFTDVDHRMLLGGAATKSRVYRIVSPRAKKNLFTDVQIKKKVQF